MTVNLRRCARCRLSYEAGTYAVHKTQHVVVVDKRGRRTHSRRLARMQQRAEIVRLIRLGYSGATVGRGMGLTRERVRQIWKAETGLALPTLPEREPVIRSTKQVRRFWARVRVSGTGCWEWAGTVKPTGYGASSHQLPGGGYAHRTSYIFVRGPIPDGLTIDHLCRNRLCVNPDHLEAVTMRVNILRSPVAPAALNARKTHCIRGHAFDETNTARSRTGRRCRACAAERRRGYVRPSRRKVAA